MGRNPDGDNRAEAATIEELVHEARSGSRAALEEVVRLIQDQVYALSLRMLFHPADAEDAAQEILIKVITNLRGFRFECPFRAWVMRVAANHLRAARRAGGLPRGMDWERAQARLDRAEARGWFARPLAAPRPLLEKEMRAACAQALLLCLDRGQRLAFILGGVMDFNSQEGAYILDITPAAFRKRLSRARGKLSDFLHGNCSFFDPHAKCDCAGYAQGLVGMGWMDPQGFMFCPQDEDQGEAASLGEYLGELDELARVAAFFKASPARNTPHGLARRFKSLLGAGRYRLLDQGDLELAVRARN